MSRFFAPIEKDELITKWQKLIENFEEEGEFSKTISKDLSKVSFDFENWDWKDGFNSDYPIGYQELSNGMKCIFCHAGGDWELPVCFTIYWDGNQLRGYIPKSGNVWNRKTKSAFEGNDSNKYKDFITADKDEIINDVIKRIIQK